VTAHRILDRLRGGWRPGGDDLAGAATIKQWQIVSIGPGPYILQGMVGPVRIATIVMALDVSAGWARTPDHWLILGPRSRDLQRVISEAEILSKAVEWAERLREGGDGNTPQ
jgi:hypothetical protein